MGKKTVCQDFTSYKRKYTIDISTKIKLKL